jgi:iron-sulfur cluster repair protein YtfE (RIC family)
MSKHMKRHSGLVPLSHDHRQILFTAQLLKRGVTRYKGAPASVPEKLAYARQAITSQILPHIEREEQLLFPTVVGCDSEVDALIITLQAEHRRIAALCAVIADDQPDPALIEARLDELGVLLETHVRTEERRLFQRLQQVLPDATIIAIGEHWRADGDNAVCIRLPGAA